MPYCSDVEFLLHRDESNMRRRMGRRRGIETVGIPDREKGGKGECLVGTQCQCV